MAAQISFVSSFQEASTVRGAQALTVVNTASPYSVPAFNPSMGTLTDVEIRYSTSFFHDVSGTAQSTVFVGPLGPLPSLVRGDFQSTSLFQLRITEPGAQALLYNDTDVRSVNCSGVTVAPSCQVREIFTGNDSATLSVPTPLLGAYVSQPGDNSISFTASDQLTVLPSCFAQSIVFRCAMDVNSLFSGSVRFTYTYEPAAPVPEPASAALLLAGCGVLAALGARRARAGS